MANGMTSSACRRTAESISESGKSGISSSRVMALKSRDPEVDVPGSEAAFFHAALQRYTDHSRARGSRRR